MIAGLGVEFKNLTGLLFLVPAIGASIAATIGAIAIGSKGLGDALEAAFLPLTAKGNEDFAKQIEGLSPAIQRLAVRVRRLSPALVKVRENVS
ncbi:hypothetical protein, partial [Actinoplanes derwentensis]